jgi:predicted signal transduction protein with EAL and GGDEF domain
VVTVSASVGIAIGRRRTVDALLRDADLALYAAKAAGKDRYILFEPDLQGDAPELPGDASADDAAPSSGVPAV